MMASFLLFRLLALLAVVQHSSALIVSHQQSATKSRRPSSALRATPEEVSIAATQQLLSLAVVAVGEGVWSTRIGGATVQKGLRFLLPKVVVAGALVGASSSVASGTAETMTPGLAVSVVATAALCLDYVSRLATEVPEGEEAPAKEAVVAFFILAFFGFSTALQSCFAAGILELPQILPPEDTGVPPSFPAMSEGAIVAPMGTAGSDEIAKAMDATLGSS